jgi:uncharacterized lipoprotein NlpE involved in copper resistance
MTKTKQLLIAMFCLVTVAAVNPVFAVEAKELDASHAQHSLDWPGVYFGFLPCADCGGIKTSLALNHNNTYILMTQNVGKSIREFTEKGKFTWTDEKNVMLLTSRDGKVSHLYYVGDNKLIEVDPATGKHSSSHILERKDVMAKPPKHLH